MTRPCPYCADKVLGNIFYDQTCHGCVSRMITTTSQIKLGFGSWFKSLWEKIK